MKTADLFAGKNSADTRSKTILSYEVFPPQPQNPLDGIYQALDEFKQLQPDFISVTYGAGGGKNNQTTLKIAEHVKKLSIESIVHLPCITLTKADVAEKLQSLRDLGIENVLALRGDPPTGLSASNLPVQSDFRFASDLVAFIRETTGDYFNIVAACHPEGHVEAPNCVADIQNLKRKVDTGVNQLISQLFFDNDYFYAFLERCELAGIDVPIQAGIMPVTNRKQIERMTSLCGATIPKKFAAMMEKFEDNPIAMQDASIAYAVDQIVDLIAQGVAGIHLYTMNKPYTARKIYEAICRL